MRNKLSMGIEELILRLSYGSLIVTRSLITDVILEEKEKGDNDFIVWFNLHNVYWLRSNQNHIASIMHSMNFIFFHTEKELEELCYIGQTKFQDTILACSKDIEHGHYGISICPQNLANPHDVKNYKPTEFHPIYPIYFRNICHGVLKHMPYDEALKILNEQMIEKTQRE